MPEYKHSYIPDYTASHPRIRKFFSTCQNITVYTYQTTRLYMPQSKFRNPWIHRFACQNINFRTYQTTQLHEPEYQFSYLPNYIASYARIYIFIPIKLHSFICQIINYRTYNTTQFHIPNTHFPTYQATQLYMPDYIFSYQAE